MTMPEDAGLTLDSYLPYQLANLAKRVSDACNAEYGSPLGVSVAEWRILAQLGQHDSLHSRGLGDITFMDKSRVSRALRSLEEKGWLTRRPDPADNRASFLSLTAEGRDLYETIVPLALDWETLFLSALSAPEQDSLRKVFARLEAQLDKMENIPTLE